MMKSTIQSAPLFLNTLLVRESSSLLFKVVLDMGPLQVKDRKLQKKIEEIKHLCLHQT
ncbi:MAG: hypothetical protein J7L69_02470 [Desulfobulbaceae bacterium]|nr:hypothetical protein [Desulfobulbaceae bacterium]